jgi:hypothetical protein
VPSSRIRPRTFRMPLGSSLLVGGLARIDVVGTPARDVYVTAFVSNQWVNCVCVCVCARVRVYMSE